MEVPDTADEVAELALTINATLQRLEEAATAQRRFVADAAHELRSPLATLLAGLEVATAYPDRADWPAVVSAAGRQTQRLSGLTEELLLLARLDAGAPSAPAERFGLAALMGRLVEEYAERAGVPRRWISSSPRRVRRRRCSRHPVTSNGSSGTCSTTPCATPSTACC